MKRIGILSALILGCVVVVLLITGCETQSTPATADVTVSPGSKTFTVSVVTNGVSTGTNAVFTAGGGDGVYTWSMSDPALGTLVPANQTATYTPTTIIGNNTILVSSGGQVGTASISQN